jgi:tetratricopeptide (TPR) repeat protein
MCSIALMLLPLWVCAQELDEKDRNKFTEAPAEGLAAPSVETVDDHEAELPLNLREIISSVNIAPLPQIDMRLPDTLVKNRRQIARDQVRIKTMGYLNDGDYTRAEKGFRAMLSIDPKDKASRFGLATSLVELHKYDEAIEIFNRIIEEYPSDYFAKNNLAWLYATAESTEVRDGRKAVALAQDALITAPADYHVWSTLAAGYYMIGEYERGLRAAKEALELSTRRPGTPIKLIVEYKAQVQKCAVATQAMSILE